MLRSDKLWYELGTNYCPTCYVSSRFDPALMRLCYAWNHALISFITLYYALMRLWRFESALIRISSSVVHCYALLSCVTHWKMSRSPISCRFWPPRAINKDAADPQNHCIFDSRTRWQNNKIQKFQMYQSMIYLKKTWCLSPCCITTS